MHKDVLRILHVLATAILMLLAAQLKDIALQILETRDATCVRRYHR